MEKPLQSNESPKINREHELLGGIKNALERGDSLEEIKQSFLNAGYNSEEIESASQKLPQQISRIEQQNQNIQKILSKPEIKKSFFSKLFRKTPSSLQNQEIIPFKQKTPQLLQNPSPLQNENQKLLSQAIYSPKKRFSKVWVVTMIIVSALILIGAAILGLTL